VPVIAAASIAPVASASGVTALAFNQSSYSGTACGTITGAYVTVTVDGVAAAGKSVTTTLGGGYTFAGGSASYMGVSDGSGAVALPAITVPAVGGSATATATAALASSVSSSISAASTTSARRYVFDSSTGQSNDTPIGVPTGSTPIGATSYLSPDNTLYPYGGSAISGVAKATGYTIQQFYVVDYVLAANGSARRYVLNTANGQSSDTAAGVPTGSTPIGATSYLSPDNTLYPFGGSAISGVAKATGYTLQQFYVVDYVLAANGSARRYVLNTANGQSNDTAVGVPTGSTPIGATSYLSPDNTLYPFGGSAISGVAKATGYTLQQFYVVDYILTTNGSARRYVLNTANGQSNDTAVGVPTNSTPIGATSYLSPDNTLYAFGGKTVANVSKATGYTIQQFYVVDYTSAPSCS